MTTARLHSPQTSLSTAFERASQAMRADQVTVGEVLDGVEDVRFIRFGGEDVVRHHLVQRIVAAYADRAGPEKRR